MSYYEEDNEEENNYQQEEENDDYGMGSCPKCGSKRYTDVARGENCDDCGYYVYYP
jgi:hypothetical protein